MTGSAGSSVIYGSVSEFQMTDGYDVAHTKECHTECANPLIDRDESTQIRFLSFTVSHYTNVSAHT